ncbi:SRPBCC family protein [Gordonia sp. OPL2]|uniref:SRPBCC family protein n=1 Tax=Gordonia sp. OPL2 TaxID=2486274 RepID=UPI0016562E60|nr:SRPBCC family protein [Gordonia sp. OPL2]RPA19823.1 SRPBCC family protein [Gordonia sp. OPL2]
MTSTRRILIADVTVPFESGVDVVFDYLADPTNRPRWQASLRAISKSAPRGEGAGDTGSSWTDVTWVPGVRPHMEVIENVPQRRWREIGTWWSADADLTLTFSSSSTTRTEVRARAFLTVPTILAPGASVLALITPPALAADLRTAARLLSGDGQASRPDR